MLQAVEHVTAHGQRSRPSKRPISAKSGENTRTGWAERASMRPGWCLGTPLAEQSLLCAALPASGRIRAPSTSWGDRGRSRPAHVDQLSGRCRPLRKSYAAELSRRSSDTYECRPADRTDDYSAADFVISEVLQQTDFDEIRHGVLSGWTAPLGIEPRSWIRGSIPLPISTERALVVHFPRRAGEGLRAPVAMVVSPRPERAGQADQDGRPSGAARASIDLSVVRGVGSSTVVPGSVGSYRPVIAGANLREGTTTI